MSRDIYNYLEDLGGTAKQRHAEALERIAEEWANELAGPEQTRRIASVSLAEYERSLRQAVVEAFEAAAEHNTKAVYFEFDLDNDWASSFFLCTEYSPLSAGDDDWACEFHHALLGPDLAAFSEIYHENHFDRTEVAKGSTLFLVARTVASFVRAIEGVDIPPATAVCVAFHDQDPIMRIHET